MTPAMDGFLGLGITSITRAIESASQWAVIDELGYLESSCPEFCDAVFRLFDQKQVIAVLRSQSTPFLDALRARNDVFLYDLEHPLLPIGCVIMASGLGKRFGSNKLMADFNGKPMIYRILSATDGALFDALQKSHGPSWTVCLIEGISGTCGVYVCAGGSAAVNKRDT